MLTLRCPAFQRAVFLKPTLHSPYPERSWFMTMPDGPQPPAGTAPAGRNVPAARIDNGVVVRRTWQVPIPYGRAAAVEAMTGIAAPLLAGFSLSLLGIIAQAPASFHWPGAAMTVLCVVVALLVACVQFGFRARSYHYSRADLEAWLPGPHNQRYEDAFADQQKADWQDWLTWHGRARFTYNLAIVLLAVGLALVIAPPASYPAPGVLTGTERAIRWIGAAFALAAGAGELWWIGRDLYSERRARKTATRAEEQ